ncbi:MAG TPA: hypothetical protein VHO67_15235 [Polyangia bacterium]|nr:hypothetical protein [Polyangia bacterium]
MTPAAAVLFVFVIHGASRGPADDVVAACLRALPAGTRAVTQTVVEPPADAAVAAGAKTAGAVAAVVVTWPAADLPSADVRAVAGLPDHPRWTTRAVAFAPADQLPERARALGLVIASIVQEGLSAGRATGPGAALARPASVPPEVAKPSASPSLDSAATTVSQAAVRDEGDLPGRWAVEAGVVTAYERGTDLDDAIGGALAVRRYLVGNLAVRLGAAFRLTQRDLPDITGLALMGSVGAGWSSRRFGPAGRFGAGARVDLLAQHQSVRVSADRMVSGERDYWAAGADALGEGGLVLARDTMILLAAGLEEMFTEANVVVARQVDATFHATRFVVQLGVLSRF